MGESNTEGSKTMVKEKVDRKTLRKERRKQKAKELRVEQANIRVGRVFIIVGASVLGYGLIRVSIGNVMLGSAALMSGIVIIYMKKLKSLLRMK